MANLTRRLTISGRVQGVGFRWALRAQASALGLAGWVRNRRDGSVEALLGGAPAAVEAVTAWAHHGPPGARVDRVQVNDEPGNEWLDAASGIEQRPTF
jgi:acylphosphatase